MSRFFLIPTLKEF